MTTGWEGTAKSAAASGKYAAKWVAAQLLYRTGVLEYWLRRRFTGKAIVLAYHRVLDARARSTTWSHPAIIVSPETFERHVSVLRRVFRILRLAEFEAGLGKNAGFSSPSCLITFDDGWSDTYSEAWPALKRAQVPALVFLPVNYIDSADTFWQERLGHLLFDLIVRAKHHSELASNTRALLHDVTLDGLMEMDVLALREAIIDRVRVLKNSPTVDPSSVLRRVEALLEEPPAVSPVDRFMTWVQVREMAAGGIEFGGHGCTHRILSRLPPDEVTDEVRDSKVRIEHELRSEVTSMSYPNGGWSDAVATQVDTAGYTLAFSMDRGPVTAGDAPLSVCRINIHEGVTRSAPMFLARLAGIF